MKILLIIPAYNEAENILRLKESIENYINIKNKEKDIWVDYIIVNDGSKDNTLDMCKENNLNYVDLISNLGIGGAVQTGYKYAYQNNFDIAIQFDGDCQHDVNYIEKIYMPVINEKVNMCIGSRYLDKVTSEFKSTFMRRFGKTIVSMIIKIFTGQTITDPTSGFRAADKKVIKYFANDYPSDYPEPESTLNVIKEGLKVKEVPVSMNERENGKSSINISRSVHFMLKVSICLIIDGMRFKKRLESEK